MAGVRVGEWSSGKCFYNSKDHAMIFLEQTFAYAMLSEAETLNHKSEQAEQIKNGHARGGRDLPFWSRKEEQIKSGSREIEREFRKRKTGLCTFCLYLL